MRSTRNAFQIEFEAEVENLTYYLRSETGSVYVYQSNQEGFTKFWVEGSGKFGKTGVG